MASTEINNVNLDSDIDFIKTPAPKPSAFGTNESCGIPLTNVSFSMNRHLIEQIAESP
jgi:cyclopropane-fatty-acyl-phospholipid synthase